MATTFLAGVANARIFKGNDLFATAKTLVDSSITIGVSAEDIRAGKGAKLYGKYFHTSTFDLKMTDAMFKMEYIAANIGADMEIGGDVFADVECKGSEIFAKTAGAQPMVAGGDTYIYVKPVNGDIWTTVKRTAGATEPAYTGDDKYCVQYLTTNDNARKVVVKANFIPDTLSVYLDADLFSGDSQNPTTGTKIGTVTIKVPRFLLSGSQEIAMNMTGAAQTPFEGSALAANAEGCEGDGIYAEIIEVIDSYKWTENVTDIFFEGVGNGLTTGEAIAIFTVVNNAVKKLDFGTHTDYKLQLFNGDTEVTTVPATFESAGTYTAKYSTKNDQGEYVVRTATTVTVTAAE